MRSQFILIITDSGEGRSPISHTKPQRTRRLCFLCDLRASVRDHKKIPHKAAKNTEEKTSVRLCALCGLIFTALFFSTTEDTENHGGKNLCETLRPLWLNLYCACIFYFERKAQRFFAPTPECKN